MIRAEFAREANAADVDAEDEDLPVAVIADAVNDDNINLGRGVDNINPDPHFLVRVRGHNVEALSSYLFELIREENTCVSVLPGWSPRAEGCNRIIERCNQHPDEAFYVSPNGRTPLHEACLRGACRHVITALIQANALATVDRDNFGNIPLHLLFVDFSTYNVMNPMELDTIVAELLSAGTAAIMASSTNAEGNTPLHIACGAPETMVDPSSLKRLLSANSSCASKLNIRNQTPLLIHCQRRNASTSVASILLDADPSALQVLDLENGWAPLHYAASNTNLELIRFLLNYNPQAAPLRTTPHNESALHILCRHSLRLCHLQAIEALIIADSDSMVQRDGRHGYTPLHLVCRISRVPLEVVRLMLEMNPKAASIPDNDSYLPLHYACEIGCDSDIIALLLHVHPRAAWEMTRKQDTALSLACACNKSVETVALLIQANRTALEKRNDYGFAPIHHVCRAHQPRMGIVQTLLDASPSCVNLKTHAGETPVHLACSNSGAFVGVLQILTLAVGSNENDLVVSDKRMTNRVGNTPLHDACFRGSSFEHIETLAMTNPEWICVKNNAGYSPLQILCKNGRIDERIVTTFSRIGGPEIFSVIDSTGNTALHSAMREDTDVGTVRCLIRAFPDAVHLKTTYGDSPLHLACFRRACADVVREVVLASTDGNVSTILEPNTSGQTPISIAMDEFRSVCRGGGFCCVVSEYRPEQSRAFQVLATLVKILYYGPCSPDEDSDQSLVRACVSLHRQDVRLDPAFIRRAIHLNPEETRLLDADFNSPLHIEASIPVEKMPLLDATDGGCCGGHCHKRMGILRILLEIYPGATSVRNKSGEFPLGLMIQNGRAWGHTVALALRAFPPALHWYKGLDDRLLARILERSWKECGNDTLFALLNSRPDAVRHVSTIPKLDAEDGVA